MQNVEKFTLGEEIANAVTHGIGALLAISALVLLVVFSSFHGNPWYIVSLTIYGVSLVILYTMSTLYHSFRPGITKNIFEIFDHSSIYILIAGTYTPFELTILRGPLGWTFFGITWGMATAGILFKVFFVKKFVVISTIMYIIMGWLVIFIIRPIIEVLPANGILFLVIGGVLYTAGTIFYVNKKMKFHHMLWHFFVLGGSIFHFLTIFIYLLPLSEH